MAFIRHDPCPCGKSTDGLSVYDDGSYCQVCEKPFKDGAEVSVNEAPKEYEKKDWKPIPGHYADLSKRGIREDTCKKFGYQQGQLYDGTKVHIQNIRGPRGELLGQKTRDKDKNFAWIGPAGKDPGITGSWLWPDKGKSVVITEGEIDMMSVSQVFDNKWPTGSLPNGVGSVEKAIKKDYEKLCRFDSIVLCFDNDEPGQKALEKACELLPMGKVKIMTLPDKDANATLLNKEYGPGSIVRAFWDAKEYRPDGIMMGEEFTVDELMEACEPGYTLPYPKLQEMTYGLRKGEITMITAGSGVGKSTWARELAFDLHQTHGCRIGNIYLEENTKKTAQGYVALYSGVSLGKLRFNPHTIERSKWEQAVKEVIHKNMVFYKHFGSLDSKRLLAKMRYMRQVQNVDFIVLDHISIVTSGTESSSEGERKDIDILMTSLRSLVEETGVGVIAIVHLKRTQGKNFNEGAQVSLSDFRGSASLEQLSDNAFALERNQQAKGDKQTFTQIRILKCREIGETGEADVLQYDRSTGRNVVTLVPSNELGSDNFDPHDNTDEDLPF